MTARHPVPAPAARNPSVTTPGATPTPYYEDADAGITLYLGEALDVLPTLPAESVDAVVCDPPYGLANLHPRVVAEALAAWLAGDRAYVPDDGQGGFMNRAWDRFVPPPAVWDECLRVLKPGGHLVAFAAPRTADLMGMSIRLAGFEIRDSLHWIYGSGMPKGQNIGKAIDRRRDDRERVLQVTTWLAEARDAAGWTNAQVDALWGFNGMAGLWTTQGKAAIVPQPEQWDRLREAMGFDDAEIRSLVAELNGRKGELGEAWARREVVGTRNAPTRKSDHLYGDYSGDDRITAPATDAAKQWHGWNTQLRPAHEPIILARKSTGFDTTVANVLRHGTGALNIDGCRTAGTDVPAGRTRHGGGTNAAYAQDQWTLENAATMGAPMPAGRWPTNVLLTHQPMLDADGQIIGDACADSCVAGCPVAEMDRQSGASQSRIGKPRSAAAGDGWRMTKTGTEYADSGGASRFFPIFRYEAKAPASERPRLADGTAWPTVKPLPLMQWLIRLVTPSGGTVLDWCTGTGTTLQAAALEGMSAIGIERERDGADLSVVRLSKPLARGLFGEGEAS